MQYIRIILFFLLMFAGICQASAQQSSGDKFYNQGLELQKVMNKKSQLSAIEKFTTAKKFYDSAVKKKQCDAAIATCRNIIKQLSKPTGGGGHQSKGTSSEISVSALTVSNEMLNLEPASITVTVSVTTTEKEWSVTPVANEDGSSFLSIKKDDDGSGFSIECAENTTTHKRSQRIDVIAGNQRKTITVNQKGKPTMLSVEKSVVEFSLKGGNKSIDVYSNSDERIKENNLRNWKVISKPDWVTVVSEEKKSGGIFSKVKETAKNVVKGKNATQEDSSMITSVMKISVLKSSVSRSGELIIGSEDQRATILIQQN